MCSCGSHEGRLLSSIRPFVFLHGCSPNPYPHILRPLGNATLHRLPVPLSDVFEGLSHADRLALVFTALHDELAATSPPPSAPPPPLSSPSAASPTSSPHTRPQPIPSSTRPTTPKAKSEEPPATEGNDAHEGTSADTFDMDNQSTDRGSVPVRPRGGDGERAGGEGEARAAAREIGGEGGLGEEEEVDIDRERPGTEGSDREGDGSGREGEREGVDDPAEGGGESGTTIRSDDGSGEDDRRTENSRRQRRRPRQHRVIRGGVKASYVGPNVETLPVWGALDAIAGSSLLVDCRTPAQWRPHEYRPTAQVGFRTCRITSAVFRSNGEMRANPARMTLDVYFLSVSICEPRSRG